MLPGGSSRRARGEATRERRVQAWLLPFLLLLGVVGCARETVAHQQREREANRMLVLLRRAGIEARKVKDDSSRDLRFNVVVRGSDGPAALLVLEQHNLPEKPRTGTAESFGAGGMIPTAEQERAKRIVGVEGDIVNSLRNVPRVISVEAAVSIPEDDPLRDETVERPRPKASVILVYLPDATGTPPVSVEEVQRHVQAKLPEVKSSEVNVLLLPSTEEGEAEQPPPDCPERERVLGIELSAGEGRKVLNLIIGAVALSGVMAGLAVVAVLRAMRYRRDLTRLTAQFQQVRK